MVRAWTIERIRSVRQNIANGLYRIGRTNSNFHFTFRETARNVVTQHNWPYNSGFHPLTNSDHVVFQIRNNRHTKFVRATWYLRGLIVIRFMLVNWVRFGATRPFLSRRESFIRSNIVGILSRAVGTMISSHLVNNVTAVGLRLVTWPAPI